MATDLRGFGHSSWPKERDRYGSKNITSDLAHLLDALNLPRAVFVGHDWGGSMVWRMCLYHPDRVIAVCGIATPFVPPQDKYKDLDSIVKVLPQFSYQHLLGDTARSSAILDPAPRRLLTATYRFHHEWDKSQPFKELVEGVVDSDDPKYTQQSALLTKDEMDYYVREYSASGFGACNNFYATMAIDYVNERSLPRKIAHPALYIGAADDHILKPQLALLMRFSMTNLSKKIVKNAGHWILWEQTEQVNKLLLEWLGRVTNESPAAACQQKKKMKRRLRGIAAVTTAVLAGALALKKKT